MSTVCSGVHQILPAAHFDGRCKDFRVYNRFESTAFLVMAALSFSDTAKP
jgi:hypothetical protein